MISIIICTYNRDTIIGDCLSSIVNAEKPRCAVEIIVIDNNSQDCTQQKAHNFINHNKDMDIRLIKEEKQGLAFARNRGIKEARGDLLIFIDDDAVIDSKCLISYCNYYKKKRILCMGGKILPWYRDARLQVPNWFNRTNWGVLSMLDKGDEDRSVVYPDYPYGGNLAVAKILFDEFGGFNENMGRKGNNLASNMEIEFMLRLEKAGKEIYYVPGAVIYHLIQEDRLNKKFFFLRYYAQGNSDAYLFAKSNGMAWLIRSLSKRIVELLFIPLQYFHRRKKQRPDYFKPILRSFYNLAYILETMKLLFWKR